MFDPLLFFRTKRVKCESTLSELSIKNSTAVVCWNTVLWPFTPSVDTLWKEYLIVVSSQLETDSRPSYLLRCVKTCPETMGDWLNNGHCAMMYKLMSFGWASVTDIYLKKRIFKHLHGSITSLMMLLVLFEHSWQHGSIGKHTEQVKLVFKMSCVRVMSFQHVFPPAFFSIGC